MGSGWNELLLLSVNFVLHLAIIHGWDEFQCSNGKSIPDSNVCDLIDDCGDNSDESRSNGALCGMLKYIFLQ